MSKNKVTATQQEVEAKIKELIIKHAVPQISLRSDSPVWEHFPANEKYKEAPEVGAFCQALQEAYSVYLSETQWDVRTISELAENIIKDINSDTSKVDKLKKELKLTIKGFGTVLIFNSLLGLGIMVWLFQGANEGGAFGKIATSILMMLVLLGIPILLYIKQIKDLRDLIKSNSRS